MDGPKDYLPPTDPGLAALFHDLDEDAKEYWSERAAIREYEGGLPRAKAEALAMLDTQTWLLKRTGRRHRPPPIGGGP